MITITLTEEERRELEKCLIVDIDRWEDRLERKRGTNTEKAMCQRISVLQDILSKVYSNNMHIIQ